MKMSDFANKQVINVKDGTVIGRISDLEFNEVELTIKIFIVEKPGGFLSRILPNFFPTEKVDVRVENVVNIGSDVLLIKIY